MAKRKKTKKALGDNKLVLPGSTQAEELYNRVWANRTAAGVGYQKPKRKKAPYEL